MKEIISAFLSVFLAFFTPACTIAGTLNNTNAISADTHPTVLSAPAAEQDSEKAAGRVKAALQLDGKFSSSFSDDPQAPRWNLTWEKDFGTISVEATKNGTITAYSLSPSVSPDSSTDLIPREEAMRTAGEFLGKVLRSTESPKFGKDSASAGAYCFSGEILLNGLPSPMAFSISVRDTDGEIVEFRRDGLDSCIGGVPSSAPAITPGEAGEKLKSTMSLNLEYVLEDGKAVLRYIPEKRDEYFVDAKTGKLGNLTRMYELILGNSDDNAAASDCFHLDLESVSPTDDVLPLNALDKEMRSITPLGLQKYELTSSGYAKAPESNGAYATLTYTRKGGESVWTRTVVCNAKTGGLVSVCSSIPEDENHPISISQSAAHETAKDFLLKYFEKDFKRSAIYRNAEYSDGSLVFVYAQRENGYFFPENSLAVAVDVTDGSISGFSHSWTDVEFDGPDGILNEDSALDAWFGHYGLTMRYIAVPTRLPSIMPRRPMRQISYSMRLAYILTEPDGGACGADAKTGEIVVSPLDQEPVSLFHRLPSFSSNSPDLDEAPPAWCLTHGDQLA